MAVSLAGKVALITGASSGIGRALAIALGAEGVSLALAARSVERLEAVKAAAKAPDAISLPTDLTNPANVDAMVRHTLDHYGRIDILLANAGIYTPGDVADGVPDDWDAAISVNVNSVFRAIRATLDRKSVV